MGRRSRRRKRQKKYFFMEGIGEHKDRKEQDKNQKTDKSQKTDKVPSKNRSYSYSGSYGSGYGNWSSRSDNSYTSYTSFKKQPVQNPDNIINTDKGCFEFFTSKAWGTILVPVEDPKACKVTVDELHTIKLVDEFPKISAPLWAKWISLCFHFCPERKSSSFDVKPKYDHSRHRVWNVEAKKYETYCWEGGKRVKCEDEESEPFGFYSSPRANSSISSSSSCHSGELEVEGLLCRKADDLSQWRILIPKQEVSGGHVHADLSETCDIETGEMFTAFPPDGWLHAGSSHSHNTMSAFFSSVDDKSELTVPGLHIVIGKIDHSKMTYDHKSSIVLRQMRKKIDLSDVVDTTPLDEDFHPNVLKLVSKSGDKKPEPKSKSSSFSFEKWLFGEEDDDDKVVVSPFCSDKGEVYEGSKLNFDIFDDDVYDEYGYWAGFYDDVDIAKSSKNRPELSAEEYSVPEGLPERSDNDSYHESSNSDHDEYDEYDLEAIIRYYQDNNPPLEGGRREI